MGSIFSWSFSIEDYISPWIDGYNPTSPSERDVVTSAYILDDYSGIDLSSLDAYVDGYHAFTGPSTFISPYDGAASKIVPATYDGYNGYKLFIDNTNLYDSNTYHTVNIKGADAYGNTFDENYTFKVASIPTILDLYQGPFEITLDLKFSTEMLQNSDLVNPTNYAFNNNMYIRKVDVISPYIVRLWAELFYGYDSFTLTVGEGVKGVDGYGLESGTNTKSISPFKSDATFTNYNGLIRTWHESTIVLNDSQRIYLAGVKGIDVFRKKSTTNFTRWGQIFDEYGIDSMYVANFPSDLEITDEVPPRLVDQVPSPSSFAAADTRISFKVRDDITAVEITTLRVYVNGYLAFSGSPTIYGSNYISGFNAGWNGNIEIEHQQLSVEMWADSLFDTGSIVTVRVVAQDLMENEMDETYVFSIIIPLGGFGGVPFGGAPFGGV